jgi:hypothetical protein
VKILYDFAIMNHHVSLKTLIRRKYRKSQHITLWWQKFAVVRRRRVWRLSEQQNHHCCYCAKLTWFSDGTVSKNREFQPDRLPGMTKQQLATADHIVPTAKGGSEHIDNIVMACTWCNQMRGDMPALEFWAIMQDPKKLRALIAERGRSAQKNKSEKDVKRAPKRDGFVVQLGCLLYCSPEARQIANEAVMEIESHFKLNSRQNLPQSGSNMADELHTCSHKHRLQEPHICPFQCNVHNDEKFLCRCCEQCEQDCSDDI